MREYRGKSVLSIEELNDKEIPHKNGWVYGWYVDGWIVGNYADSEDEWIAFEWWSQVIPETVGQSTGLHDKNGTEIYEGDVLLERDSVIWEQYEKDDGSKWSRMTNEREDKYYTVFFDQTKSQFTTKQSWLWAVNKLTEVIGNIHDKAGDE